MKASVQTNCELALSHYDIHLGNIYGGQWPSMRLALLSQPKYCAVMNNFCSDHSSFLFELAERGAFDFVSRFKPTEEHTGKYSLLQEEVEDDTAVGLKSTEGNLDEEENKKLPLISSPSDMLSFVPGARVLSSREAMMRQEDHMHHTPISLSANETQDSKEGVTIATSETFNFPHKLQAVLHSRGDMSDFSPAKRDQQSGKLAYYLMDAGSVLPVLALDLFPGCEVLDMCSAPGGKTFAMLQTMLPGSMVCLDRSYSRIVRLRNSLRAFFPKSYSHLGDNRVQVKQTNACTYGDNNPEGFDRVLVDVPCYADRHSLADIDNEDNTLFKSSRQQDRIGIQALQQQLLISGLKACKPGGLVVYSTCTLFPSQNDVVVRRAVERACEQKGVEAEVVDTGSLAEAYGDFFSWQGGWKGKVGQLVVPNMTANFGPTYFCKIRRLK